MFYSRITNLVVREELKHEEEITEYEEEELSCEHDYRVRNKTQHHCSSCDHTIYKL